MPEIKPGSGKLLTPAGNAAGISRRKFLGYTGAAASRWLLVFLPATKTTTTTTVPELTLDPAM